MRFPAKALPCLLLCVACTALTPTSASAHPLTASPLPPPRAAATPRAVQGALRFDAGHQVARRRTKVRHVAPKVAASSPHEASNRFLMTQDGRQMTADDFEAWMKSRGIRVAKGAPEASTSAE